jgi:hypothetical protein
VARRRRGLSLRRSLVALAAGNEQHPPREREVWRRREPLVVVKARTLRRITTGFR